MKTISKERIKELKTFPLCYRLQKLRLMSGLSQQELGEKICVKQPTISAWEIGRVIPQGRMLERIILLYDLPMDYFIDVDIEKVKLNSKKKQ